MRSERYRRMRELLLAGEPVRLESALGADDLGRERLSWPGGTLGEVPPGDCFEQTLTPPAHLVICGGGHVARALAPAAHAVGFRVTVLENRPEVLADGAFPAEIELRCGGFAQLLRAGGFGPHPFYAVMTRGHQEDWTCLREILKLPRSYVGMMGSRQKAFSTREALAKAGVAPADIESFRSPIGLPIGAETPEEIAVSIVAELIQRRRDLGIRAPLEGRLIQALDRFPYAMVTLVDSQGSTPRSPGARMLVFPDGSTLGTVGGGAGEAMAVERAREALAEDRPGLYTCRMDASGPGGICGGTARYLVIPVKEDDFTC